MGVLAATGLIVGESLFGVLLAGIVVAAGSPTPLAVVGDCFRARRPLAAALCSSPSLPGGLYRRSTTLAA